MRRWPSSVLPVLVLVCQLLTACQSMERSGKVEVDAIAPGVTNREDLYLRYGPPQFVYDRTDRSGQTLVYTHTRLNGIDLGVRLMPASFSLASARSLTASLLIDLSRDGVVSRVRELGASPPSPPWSFWPFGD